MPTDLLAFFVWIGATGTVSGFIAWLLANWTWFARLGDTKPLLQQAIKLTISVVLSVLSYALVTYVPADTVAQFNPLWAAIAAGINVIVMQTTQAAHAWYADLLMRRVLSNLETTLMLIEDTDFANAKDLLVELYPHKPDAFREALIAAANKRSVATPTVRPAANTLVAGVPAKTINAERPPLPGTPG